MATKFFFALKLTPSRSRGGSLRHEQGPRQRRGDRICAGTSPVAFSDIEAVRVQATSKDGTEVPMTIIHQKGARTERRESHPAYGYGGYGISRTPSFDFTRRVWLDQGGIIAIANLRGGGEFGEEWHKSGQPHEEAKRVR